MKTAIGLLPRPCPSSNHWVPEHLNRARWFLICITAFTCLIKPAIAQQTALLCGYSVSWDQNGPFPSLNRYGLYPGTTYTIDINTSGGLTPSSGCIGVSVGQGADIADVTVSNLTYVGPQDLEVTVSVASGAQPSQYAYSLVIGPYVASLGLVDEAAYWILSVAPPPPPSPPAPPSPPSCSSASISSIVSDTWQAGDTIPIRIYGSGFTCNSLSAITVTPTVQGSSVAVGSNWTVVTDSEISAVVTPAAIDPNQPVTVNLYGESVIGGPRSETQQAQSRSTDVTEPPTGPLVATGTARITNGTVYVLDPYLAPFNGLAPISQGDLINSLASYQSVRAKGIIADGTATAIVVYRSGTDQPVTLTATNGASLSSWDQNFLEETPSTITAAGGSHTSLSVPSSSFIHYNNDYYAFALLQAGDESLTTLGADITVSADDSLGNSYAPEKLVAVQVPVLLVHGLWGTKDSLSSLASFIQTKIYPPASADPISSDLLVDKICYSRYLGFDAMQDDIPPFTEDNTDPTCEKTSYSAVQSALYRTFDAFQHAAIVGGRVDYIGHSMGGLVLRNYVSGSGDSYRSTLNRYAGLFRDIITIDTPEDGSPLADALDIMFAPKTGMPSSPTYGVWKKFCGIKPGITVQQCFFNRSLPLAYQGSSSLAQGAVASLMYHSAHVTGLPNPNIPGASWFAIASVYSDPEAPSSGTAPCPEQSEMRVLLNDLVGALYSHNPPTLAKLLIGSPNDVIVPLESQIYGNPAQYQKYQCLAHSSVTPAWLSSFPHLLPGYLLGDSQLSDDAVTKSASVENQIASWLVAGSGGGGAMADEVGGIQNTRNPRRVSSGPATVFSADDRLAISANTKTAVLGKPVHLTLDLAPGAVTKIVTTERKGNVEVSNSRNGIAIGSADADIVQDQGERKIIEITPLRVGSITVSVSVMYDDGGLATKEIILKVRPSSSKAKGFQLDEGRIIPVVLDESDSNGREWLHPSVKYEDLDDPVSLDGCEGIDLSVLPSDGDPVIAVESNGRIHGLREGYAVVVGKFDGLEARVVVHVYRKEHLPSFYPRFMGDDRATHN